MAKHNTHLIGGVQIIQVTSESTSTRRGVNTDSLADTESHVVPRRSEPLTGTSRNARKKQTSMESNVPGKAVRMKGPVKSSRHTVIEVTPDESERLSVNRKQKTNVGSNIFVCTEPYTGILKVPKMVPAPNGRREEVAIQTGSEQQRDELVDIFRSFLQLMYFIGLSTYDPRRDRKESMKTISDRFFKSLFWAVALLSFLQTLEIMKVNWMVFAIVGGITNFVDVGFRIIPILVEIYIAHMFAFQHSRIRRMLGLLEWICTSGTSVKRRFARRIMMLLAFISILTCTLETIFADVGLMEWSLEKMTLEMSRNMGYGLFLWNPSDLSKKNVTAKLNAEYGTSINWMTIIMGIIGTFMNLCNNLKLELIIDLIIIAGWCLKECIRRQAEKVQNIDFRTYTNGNDCDELDSPTGHWAEYRELKAANDAMNAVFDGILKFMHVYNIMMCTYFLMHLIDTEVTGISFWFLLYNIAKLGIAYYIAKQSHGYNAVFQKWMRDWAKHSKDTVFLLRVPAILEEMKAEPLGLGTGEFIIGEGFILKFIGMVGSIFMLQVDKAE